MKIFIFSIVRREDEFLVNRNTSHLTLAGRWHTAGESSAQSGILHCVPTNQKVKKKKTEHSEEWQRNEIGWKEKSQSVKE